MYNDITTLFTKVQEDNDLVSFFEKNINNGKISNFQNNIKLMQKTKKINVFIDNGKNLTLDKVFKQGLNVGKCGLTSTYLSFCFKKFTLVEYGECKILFNTPNSPFGEHAWVEVGDYIYDTTLMLMIQKKLAYEELGYMGYQVKTSKCLFKEKKYLLQKEFALEKNIKSKMFLLESRLI